LEPASLQLMNVSIDSARLMGELETLAGFSAAPAPAVTRIVFSEEDLQARAWFKEKCVSAGLIIREDAVGNTFARWVGAEAGLPAVCTGSHIDAIPHSGRYDGTVGVLGGLEAIRALQEAGVQLKRSIELLLFTSEEPTRFGIGCLGSRFLCGSLAPAAGETLRDREGNSLNEVRAQAGFTGALESARLSPDAYAAFLELHIEQGPLLEQRKVQLGVVTAIAAPASVRVTIEGQGGHAGAVLMPARHDAFLAAAEIALALENVAKSTGAIDSVATTGLCDVFPGAVNSIPSRVRLEADIRDIDGPRRDGMVRALEESCRTIASHRGVTIKTEVINQDAPAICDPQLVSILSEACEDVPFDRMVSRAYHDSLFMSRLFPVAMLFIPCHKGYSHRPDEYASPEAIAHGAQVLARALAKAANQ
jgi:ureidoglycolate amidohydrolase